MCSVPSPTRTSSSPPATTNHSASIDPGQAEQLRQQVDPDRLRCEPRGCEVWRLDGVRGLSTAASAGGRVALIDGSTVVLVDAHTGEQLMRHDVSDVMAADSSVPIGRPTLDIQLTLVDGGVVAVDRHRLVRIDDDGTRAWSVDAPLGVPWGVYPAHGSDRVAVEWETASGRALRTLYDAADGSIVWEAWDSLILLAQPDVLVTLEGTYADPPSPTRQVQGISTRDGRPLWSRTIPGDSWPSVFGSLVLLEQADPAGPGDDADPATSQYGSERDALTGEVLSAVGAFRDTSLVDGRTGEVLATFADHLLWMLPVGHEGLVALTAPHPVRGEPGTTVGDHRVTAVAYGLDGTERWRTELPVVGTDCCHDLTPLGDGTMLVGLSSGLALRLDLATGAILAAPFEAPTERHSWASEDGSATITWEPRSLRYSSDDGVVRILGVNPWIVSEDPIVAHQHGQLLGVRPVPEDGPRG